MNKYIYKARKKAVQLLLFINKQKHKYLLTKEKCASEEEQEALDYIERYGVNTYTNMLSKEYKASDIEVFIDKDNNMKYVHWNNKKMYMPKGMCDEEIQDYIAFLYSEQDIHSPHSYSHVDIPNHSVVVDIGAAEGNFTLDIIEKTKKAYLFECNPKWLEALEETFWPYKDKVVIINAFIGMDTPLDRFLQEVPDVVKIDAEGAEGDIITTSEIILKYRPLVIAAAYHSGGDAERLQYIFSQFKFKTHFTDRFLMFLYSFKTSYPLLRRGLIIATKEKDVS